MTDDMALLSEAEKKLKERFNKDENLRRLPSTATADDSPRRVDQLTLPDSERGRMPFTKEKYIVRENPHLVAWEREVRKFLRNLSPDHGHRVSAAMIYEWATGLSLAELSREERSHKIGDGPSKPHTTWRGDLRKINRLLKFYFGKSYMTWIAGRKVPNAYKVRPGYYIRRHRPMTLELYAEYVEGALYP